MANKTIPTNTKTAPLSIMPAIINQIFLDVIAKIIPSTESTVNTLANKVVLT